MSLSRVRVIPYLMSLDVIGVPSSNFRPSFRVYLKVLALSLGSPRPVARSPESLLLASPGAISNITKPRPYRRIRSQV